MTDLAAVLNDTASSRWNVCPGCGLILPGGVDLHGRSNASEACWQLYGEVAAHEAAHVVALGRLHQLTVDTYGAQHAGRSAARIGVAFALIGLRLSLDEGWSGEEVRDGPPAPCRELPRMAGLRPTCRAEVDDGLRRGARHLTRRARSACPPLGGRGVGCMGARTRGRRRSPAGASTRGRARSDHIGEVARTGVNHRRWAYRRSGRCRRTEGRKMTDENGQAAFA